MNPHTTRLGRLLGLICLLLLIVPVSLVAARPARQVGTPAAHTFDTVAIGDTNLSDPADLAAAARSPKLDSALQDLARAAETAALADTAAAIGARLSDDQVQVQIHIDPASRAAAEADVVAAGGTITGASIDQTLLQGFVAPGALEALAQSASLQYIRLPEYLTVENELIPDVGTYNTSGVSAMNANAWHTAGYRGAGVKVAVIDGGFIGYTGAVSTGNLPANVVPVSFADGQGVATDTEHGTACAEIVYDIAPQATLYIIKVNTIVDLQEAVTYAIGQGIRVISTSINWFNADAGDGNGFLNNEINRAYNAGIIWLTSAGNYRDAHYASNFISADGDQLHEFAAGNEINCFAATAGGNCYNLPAGYSIRAYMRWADWAAPVDQDYDIEVYRWNGSTWVLYASGDNVQNGGAGQTPTEFVGFTTSGTTTAYGIAIRRYSASQTAVNLDIFTPNWPLRYRTTARSIGNLAPSANVVAVAALDVTAPYPLESYSSAGPSNGAGGSATGGRVKPDLSGFANVDTYAYGATPGSKFNGTSSATPHVAGAATLIRAAYASSRPADVQSFLFGRAIEMGVAGKDNDYGWGRVWLGPAPAQSLRIRFDLNADRRADIVWRHATNGSNSVWLMNGGNTIGSASLPRVAELSWQIAAVGDFNADNRSDLVWRNSSTGANSIWFMNGGTILSTVGITAVADANWRIAAAGDFNADNRSDLLWRNSATGANVIWFMNGGTLLAAVGLPSVTDANWRIAGTGDFNGDSKADIAWRHATSGDNSIWLLSGATITIGALLPRVADLNWRIAGIGDFNRDTRSDILWRNSATGDNTLWTLSGTGVIANLSVSRVTDLNWQIVNTGDANADYRADILWRHRLSGANSVWLMNSNVLLSGASITAVTDTNWRIVGNTTIGGGASNGPFSVADAPIAEASATTMSLDEAPANQMDLGAISAVMAMSDPITTDLPGADNLPSETPAVGTRVYLPLLMR